MNDTTTSWYRLSPARMLVELMETPDAAEWRARSERIARALAMPQRGLDPWADAMLDEAEAKVEAAKARTQKAREAKRKPVTALSQSCDRVVTSDKTNKRTNEQTNRRTIYPDPESPSPAAGAAGGAESESDRGKKGDGQPDAAGGAAEKAHWDELAKGGESVAEMVAGCSDGELPGLALWFCMEEGNDLARKIYRGTIRRAGAAAFRQELAEFVSEVSAGEEPDSRGKAFMARARRLK